MKKKTKQKLIRGGIAGALGAAIAGGTAYLLSNKKARQKLGNILKDVEEMGEEELGKVLKNVKSAKVKTEKKVKLVKDKVLKKNKKLA